MQVTREVAEIINSVVVLAKNRHYELVTPELVLYVICGNKIFAEAFEDCGGNISELSQQLEGYFSGIDCGGRGTSCSDQLARGVRAAFEKANAD